MPDKPQHFDGYNPGQTELAERVLLDVWSRLGEYRKYLVLVGGMVPRYLVEQPDDSEQHSNPEFTHCGTMDVDLGISIGITKKDVYKEIHDTLIDSMGFQPGRNSDNIDQKHSFIKEIQGVPVSIDFLTVAYNGPDHIMRKVQSQLTAIQVKGLGMALDNPDIIQIRGELLDNRGTTTEQIRVCRVIPFIVLKALAFENRREPKDAYDLIYALRNYHGGPANVAKMIEPSELLEPSFNDAVEVLKSRFRNIGESGPRAYSNFLNGDEPLEAQAVAAVCEFISYVTGK